MAGRICNFINSRQYRGPIVLPVLLVIFLLSVCTRAQDCVTFPSPGQVVCYPSDASCSCNSGMEYGNGTYWSSCKWTAGTYGNRCTCIFRCFSRCSVEKLECEAKGWSWDDSNCICNDPSICAEYRSQCEEVGGIFHGVVSTDGAGSCCRGTCNICGGESFTKLYEMKSSICLCSLLT